MKNLFKGKTLSLVTSGLILSSTMAFSADSVDDAFKQGKASGGLAVYGVKTDAKENNADSGYGNANATIAFETASFYGFNVKAEFKGNLSLGEIEKDDRRNGAPFENNSLMTEAYLKYAMEGFALTAGRQAIDLEWLGDYNEAVVAEITAIKDTTIILGYTSKKAESEIDLSEDFSDVNENKGIYALDIKYAGLEGIEFNPYAYSAPDVADWYGLKTTFEADNLGLIAHYALSSEDIQDDGSIGHIELNGNLENLTAAVGYIKTDKDVGAATIAKYGDNISPFEDGNQVYEANAKTTYASIGYTIAEIELGALYGETKYEDDYKEKELNLTIGYSFTESLAASVLYADIKADKDNGDFDYNKVLASVEYTF